MKNYAAFTAMFVLASLFVFSGCTNIFGGTGNSSLSGDAVSAFSKSDVAARAEKFIKANMIPETVTLTVGEVTDKGSVYLIKITLDSNGQTADYDTYMTKDGKFFFSGGYEITDTSLAASDAADTADTAAVDYGKADVPSVKMFVMAFCPYGQQAETGLIPVARLLGDSIAFEPHYVIYKDYQGGSADYCINDGKLCSMHGTKELNEDVRQLCIWKYYNQSVWLDYVEKVNSDCSLSDIETCWKTAAQAAGVSETKVTACQNSEAVELLTAEQVLDEEYGAQGSPYVFINEVAYSGARAPENFKSTICGVFNSAPEECSQTLGTATGATTGSC
ncbi:MAG: hypothetical protein V1911_03920 [Candidatus Micrarchaeota archaeon]